MKVADLQQHLNDLSKVLESAGAGKSVIADLRFIVEGLTLFREHGLNDFAAFLKRAESYDRDGIVPVIPPKGRRTTAKSPSSAKEPAPDVATLAQETKRVYEQAADHAVTVEMIDALTGHIGKLNKDGVHAVATAVELRVAKSASKGSIVDAIRKRILDRKGSYQRSGLLDRTASPTHSPSGMP